MTTDERELRERLEALFLDEIDEQVERLEQGLEVLVRSLPDPQQGIVDEMFRSVHSLKGAAQAVGFSTVASVCHHLEEMLARLRDGSLAADEPLLRGLGEVTGAVSRMGQDLRRGVQPTSVDVTSMLSGLVSEVPMTTEPPAGEDAASSNAVASLRSDPGRASEPANRGGSPSHAATVRVAREKLDALLAHAGDLITSSYRSEGMVTQIVALAGRTGQDTMQAQRDRERVDAALEAAARDDPRLRGALDRTRERAGELERLANSAAAHQRALRGLATSFAAATRSARTVPFADATSGLHRLVRELADHLGKQAVLVVHAADVEIDKDLVATVHHALVHIVRNAVDHGIEPPKERLQAGKQSVGRVEIDVTLRSDGIKIVVADDGRGVQLSKVREAAENLGLGTEGLRDMSLAGMLFQPGLSTAARVSTVSGRGVGLDAVRADIESTGGSVAVESTPGAGTTLRLLLPLTQSTLRAVLARCSDQVVAVPTSSIDAVREFRPEHTRLGGRPVVQVNGEAVPVLALSQLLGWAPTARREMGQAKQGLLATGIEGSVVLVVDELLGEREIVLRPPSDRLAAMSTVLGTTQLEQGSLALVLSPAACVRAALSTAYHDDRNPVAHPARRGRVLLVEDSITARELERRILESAGHVVAVAVDGEQAWRMLEEDEFDVVVSDVNMPRMDGLELCNAIRASRQLRDLPVVLLTSLHREADRQKGLDAGADAYLTKSGLDRAELIETVGRFL